MQVLFSGDPYENRTHDCALRGRRLNRLTNGPYYTVFATDNIIPHFIVKIKCFFKKSKKFFLKNQKIKKS